MPTGWGVLAVTLRRLAASGVVMAIGVMAGCSAGSPTASSPSAGSSSAGAGFLLTSQEASALKGQQSRFASVIQQCDKQLSAPPKPVKTLALAQHYISSGVDVASQKRDVLAPDAQRAYREGLCYLITGNSRYAQSAQAILDAWAQTLTSAPTLQGKDALNFDMPYMIAAAEWVREADRWNPARFTAFLKNVVLPDAELSNPNNHGMWAVLLVASAATFDGDSPMLSVAKGRWAQILQGEVSPDGSMPREAERSDTSNYRGGPDKGIKGIAYTHFTLLPASVAAKLFADAGQPVWNTTAGKLLDKAFGKAAQWTLAPQTFPYYAGDKTKLIGVNNASYFPLLLKYYPNPSAKQIVASGKITADGFELTKLFATSG